MTLRVINTTEQYEDALSQVSDLIALDPEPGTAQADRLDLLMLLIGFYEEANTSFQPPDPIDAIRFRMDQQDLSQRDLVPYIGSRSKVSEVLSRKRPLTIQMIRALNSAFDIPAKVLLQESPHTIAEPRCNDFPIKEMVKRKWLPSLALESKAHCDGLLLAFISEAVGSRPPSVFFRQTIHERTGKEQNRYVLLAWTAKLLDRTRDIKHICPFKRAAVDKSFLERVARLSSAKNGPILAKDLLFQTGIFLIVEPHLKGMKVDGASTIAPSGNPVIGLTLRYDRLDNFWFTLLHELAHVKNHLRSEGEIFVDDLEIDYDEDLKEREADKLARDAFIPRHKWPRSDAFRKRTPEATRLLAEELEIHPAVVAGRIRRETRNYKILNQFVGHGMVRRFFPETLKVYKDAK